MNNLFQADLYRMRTQKAVRVILLVYTLVTFFEMIVLGMTMGNAEWFRSMLNDSRAILTQSGMYDEAQLEAMFYVYDSMKAETITEFLNMVFPTNLSTAMAFFIAFFVLYPDKYGYTMHFSGNYSRKDIMISRMYSVFVFSGILTLITFSVSIPAILLDFENIPFGNAGLFLVYFVLETGLTAAYGLLLLLISELFGNRRSAGTIIIFYALFISGIIYSIVDSIMAMVTGGGAFLEYATPLGNLQLISISSPKTFIMGALVFLLYTGAYWFLELRYLKNKDLI